MCPTRSQQQMQNFLFLHFQFFSSEGREQFPLRNPVPLAAWLCHRAADPCSRVPREYSVLLLMGKNLLWWFVQWRKSTFSIACFLTLKGCEYYPQSFWASLTVVWSDTQGK